MPTSLRTPWIILMVLGFLLPGAAYAQLISSELVWDGDAMYQESWRQATPSLRLVASSSAKQAAEAEATGGQVRDWVIDADTRTLKSLLSKWSSMAGWQLSWEVPVDYVISTNAKIRGTFEHALETVASGIQPADNPFQAIFYKGNHVLRIVPTSEKP
jgi:hypothetical protein